jgi:hypothetical protein
MGWILLAAQQHRTRQPASQDRYGPWLRGPALPGGPASPTVQGTGRASRAHARAAVLRCQLAPVALDDGHRDLVVTTSEKMTARRWLTGWRKESER